ncbi:MAG: cadherin-like domain-containing protein [Prolixibacteraceae bacterium]|nr:cadherin-like domain-containing protein [Prolixibacteraceae bacterium]
MNSREFFRFHLLKVLLGLIVLMLATFAFIQNYNHRPLAQTDNTTVIEDRTVSISPLMNDTDKDRDNELTLKSISPPLFGKAEQKANKLFYTPETGFTGIDSFAYTISDGKKESKKAYVVIQVIKNLAPVTNRDIGEVYSGGSTLINVLGNDNDNEGDSIFIEEFTQPLFGKLSKINNKLVYSAGNGPAQADSFMYIASDGKTNSNETPVIISIKSKNDPCYPWLSADVGDAAIPGNLTCENKSILIEASGSDIWNNRDGFHYAYQYVNGDCEMLAKVQSLEATNEWAKAGLMIREDLSGGSKMAFVCVTNKNGITNHKRMALNNGVEGGERYPEVTTPYWVKIIRKGDTFSYFVSPDGNSWKLMESAEVFMQKNVYVGFAVTSHNNSETCKAEFRNYKLVGKAARY